MKPTEPEFIVVGVVEGRDNLFQGEYRGLIGRCGGLDIPRGSRFSAVYQCEYPNGLGEEPVRVSEESVRLEVLGIQVMNRSLERMGRGMTGTLFVRGDGLDKLQPGWVVGDPLVVSSCQDLPESSTASSSERSCQAVKNLT